MGQAEVPKQERWEVEPIRKEAEEGLAFGLCSTIWGSRCPEQSRGVGWLCSFGEREPELDSDREVVGVALREGVAVGRDLGVVRSGVSHDRTSSLPSQQS